MNNTLVDYKYFVMRLGMQKIEIPRTCKINGLQSEAGFGLLSTKSVTCETFFLIRNTCYVSIQQVELSFWMKSI